MNRERWGTFAVNDHLRRRAFVADVLLYDRLVIPYPPGDDRIKWKEEGWKPDRLDDYLEILGDLAIRVAWDEQKREIFRARFMAAQDINFDTRNLTGAREQNIDPFQVTRVLLGSDFLPDLPRGVSKVWALAAYPSSKAYKQDYTINVQQQRQERLGMVISHRFLMPIMSGKSGPNLLKQAVKLTRREDFQKKRAQLYKWQENVIENDIPDDKAVEEMERYLKEYNQVVERAVHDVYWKFAFTVIPIGLSIAGATLVSPLLAAGALVSLAKFIKFDRKPVIKAGECVSAAMFYDAQKHFK